MRHQPDETLINIKRHSTVEGFYKASVINEDGTVDSTTDWKRNQILNCGLDKVAHMFWAQVAQFCIIGNKVNPTAAAATDIQLEQPYAMNSFWLVGSGACGAALENSNVFKLKRTYDFYKESSNVVITEAGFKESPAAKYLFSRVVLDPPQKLRAGQFMRMEYELHVRMSPSGIAAPNPVPTISGGWVTSSNDREALQLVGLCGINTGTSVAEPFDAAGFCNEPCAPGQRDFGPGLGFCNRWTNGIEVTYHTGSPSISPTGHVGPLYNYGFAYRNPHLYMKHTLQTLNTLSGGADRGSFVVASNYKNYWDREVLTNMGYFAGVTSVAYNNTSVNYGAGYTVNLASNQTVAGAPNNIGHLPRPVITYNNEGTTSPDAATAVHSLNARFFDPALGVPQSNARVSVTGGYGTTYGGGSGTAYAYKSVVPFSTGSDGTVIPVPEPLESSPEWGAWEGTNVAGASCFLSTVTGEIISGLGHTPLSRATGVGGVGCVELPLRLEPYISGSYTRQKYCLFDTIVGNGTWYSLGIGPTSNSIIPSQMTGAALNPGYVYLFRNGTGNLKASTHQLKLTFQYSWSRA